MKDILIEIDSIYIDSRYPSGLGILPNGFPTKNEAKRIYEKSIKLFKQIESLLNLSGNH